MYVNGRHELSVNGRHLCLTGTDSSCLTGTNSQSRPVRRTMDLQEHILPPEPPYRRLSFSPFSCGEFSDFFGGVSVDFAEHPAEELVVGKSVLLKELHDGFIAGDQIMIKMRNTYTVHML